MQTIFPKIATILLAICSVAFMGMAIAAFYGRPDPLAEMDATELENYAFSSTTGESTTWTVRQIIGGTAEKQHDNPYAAIVDAYKMESQRLAAATTQMNDLATTLRDRIAIVAAQQEADVKALETAIARLEKLLSDQEARRTQLSRDLQALMVETKDIRDETTSRRQDVMRLQNELEELRTDQFRLEELQRVLTDRLVRLQLENQSLDVRLKQFGSLDAGSETDEPDAEQGQEN